MLMKDMVQPASHLDHGTRRTTQNFLDHATKPGEKSTSAYPSIVRWCSMHVLNLGMTGWICASGILELMDLGLWQGNNVAETWRLAYDAFVEWARERKIPWHGFFLGGGVSMQIGAPPMTMSHMYWDLRHSQPRFSPKCIQVSDHPYPEFRAKAYNEPWIQLNILQGFMHAAAAGQSSGCVVS